MAKYIISIALLLMSVWHILPSSSIVVEEVYADSELTIVYEEISNFVKDAEQVRIPSITGTQLSVFELNWDVLIPNISTNYEQSPIITTLRIQYLVCNYLADIIYPFHAFL